VSDMDPGDVSDMDPGDEASDMDPGDEAASEGLVVSGLRKRFGGVVALDGVDLRVRPGQLVGFLGPNGSGKTTTMRAVMRLVAVDGGTIRWGGRPVDEQQRRRIGYMPQERGLYMRMGAREHIAYVGRLAGLSAPAAAASAGDWLERLGLADRRDDLVESLSSGNRQRVQLAVALVADPDLLVLDEPFGGLDPVAARTLAGILTARAAAGAAVVFSSHQLDLVGDLCEDVTIIAGGATVASGGVAELRARTPRRVVRITWEDPAVRWAPGPRLRAGGAATVGASTGTSSADARTGSGATGTGGGATGTSGGATAGTSSGATGTGSGATGTGGGATGTGGGETAALGTAAGAGEATAVEAGGARGACFEVPAGADLAAIATEAASAGRIATFSVEPPTLVEVFADLVSGGRSADE